MEEYDRENFDGRASASREQLHSTGRILSTWIGATVAAVVLAGLGGWVWHISVRDAQQVPIVRASNSPVKVRPADPGGEVTPYQNIGSYDIGAVESEAQSAIQLAPPPPEPAAEDAPMADLVAPESESAAVDLKAIPKRPEPRPVPETGALIIQPAAKPPVPENFPGTSNESADGVLVPDTPVPSARPSSGFTGPSSGQSLPAPRPHNLRIRKLTAQANEEAEGQE